MNVRPRNELTGTNPEGIVAARKNCIFYRVGENFFLVENGLSTKLELTKKAFILQDRTSLLYPIMDDVLIDFSTSSEVWIKTGDGFNTKGWKYLSDKAFNAGLTTPTPTPSVTITPTITPTGTPPSTSTPTPTPTPSITPTVTPTITPTQTTIPIMHSIQAPYLPESYAKIPDAYSNQQDFTYEFWVKLTTWGDNFGAIFSSTSGGGVSVRREGTSNWQRMNIMEASGYGVNFVNAGTMAIGQWKHYAMVRTGSKAFIYTNGENVTMVDYVLAPSGSDVTTAPHITEEWFIGGRPGGTNNIGLYMTDIRIWNLARTPAEISSSYQTVVPSNSTGLLSNWWFPNGSLNDSGPTGNTMILTGSMVISTDKPY